MFPSLAKLFAAKPTVKATRPRLRFEALEDRSVPAVLIQQVGDVLTITGDDGSDRISMSFDDTGLNVGVGVPNSPHSYIGHPVGLSMNRIEIDLKGGVDSLTYDATGYYECDPIPLAVDLGSGDDWALIDYSPWLLNNPVRAPVSVTVDAGQGNDTVSAWFSSFQAGSLNYTAYMGDNNDIANVDLGGDLMNRSTANVRVYGQGGNDTLNFETYDAVPLARGGNGVFEQGSDCRMDLLLWGGDGNDVVQANLDGSFNDVVNLTLHGDGGRYDTGSDRVQALMTLRSGSYGWVNTRVYGGAGMDFLQLDYSGAGLSQAKKDFLIDGGTGYDYYVPSAASNPYPVLNCEGTCGSIWYQPITN